MRYVCDVYDEMRGRRACAYGPGPRDMCDVCDVCGTYVTYMMKCADAGRVHTDLDCAALVFDSFSTLDDACFYNQVQQPRMCSMWRM